MARPVILAPIRRVTHGLHEYTFPPATLVMNEIVCPKISQSLLFGKVDYRRRGLSAWAQGAFPELYVNTFLVDLNEVG